jgi:hypothetical protein
VSLLVVSAYGSIHPSILPRRGCRYAVKADESTDWGTIWAAISLSAGLGLLFMAAYMKLSLAGAERHAADKP